MTFDHHPVSVPETAEPLGAFPCPRCGAAVTERFWGPCTACREQLRASAGQAGLPVKGGFEPARFEPAMHVVPNHVATKD